MVSIRYEKINSKNSTLDFSLSRDFLMAFIAPVFNSFFATSLASFASAGLLSFNKVPNKSRTTLKETQSYLVLLRFLLWFVDLK